MAVRLAGATETGVETGGFCVILLPFHALATMVWAEKEPQPWVPA